MLVLVGMFLITFNCEEAGKSGQVRPNGETAMPNWNCVLSLSNDLSITSGSQTALCDAIRRGADLRIFTSFIHNEHIDPNSDNPELIEEVSAFPCTYLVDNRWAAGIMTWRQPVDPNNVATKFGPPSMSFFLYNQDGRQAIARPYLDGREPTGKIGSSPLSGSHTPKYRPLDNWDTDTNSPSENFIWYFEEFRYFVRDDWQEVLSHETDGTVISGSVDNLTEAFTKGCEMKVAIRGLCADLAENADNAIDHEVFVHVGAGYYYTEEKLFIAGTHHLVRVVPAIPLTYSSKNWDFGWVIVRTDGLTVLRICDPYTLKFSDSERHCAIRWFVR